MSEEIFQSEIQRTFPSSCSRSERNSPQHRTSNTCIFNVSKPYKDRGRVRFEIDEFDGAIIHSREDSIAG